MAPEIEPGAVAVIGAGIIGLSIALKLQQDGHRVVVVDRDDPMQGCSAGNAGHLAETNIFPPASPDMLRQLPRLLLSKSGPLVIRPSYAHKMLPWTRHALGVLRPEAHRRVVDALAAMTVPAYDAVLRLAKGARAAHLLSRDGALIVFKTGDAFNKRSLGMPAWSRYGLDVERLSRTDVLALEPALSPEMNGGLFFRNSGRCSNPLGLGLLYAQHFTAHGGRILKADVRRIDPDTQRVTLNTSIGTLAFDKAVLCAGFWSGALLAPLGIHLPLVSERGYHLMLPRSGLHMTRPVVFGEPYFVATPMDEGLRLAGTVEFARADSKPAMHRAHVLLELARKYLPSLNGEGGTPWMGVRPSLPDGLPAIGIADASPRLLYAFGHAHNGLTLSGVTADCVSALLRGIAAPVDMAPLCLSRFGAHRGGRRAAASTTTDSPTSAAPCP